MNIAINATILDDKPAGLGVYVSNVIQELSKLTPLSVITSHSACFMGNPRIRIIKAPQIIQPRNGKLGAISRLLWLNIFLGKLLKKNAIDVLINLTHHGLLFSPVSQILTIHDLIPIKFPSQYILQYFYYRYIMPLLIRKTCAINTCSESTKRALSAYYRIDPRKIIVSGCGVSIGSGHAGNHGKNPDRYLFLVGATFGHKNFDRILHAYKRSPILQRYHIVIGGGREEYLRHLKALARDLDIEDRMRFITYVNPEELTELYAHAEIFIYPSLYEGFGIPPLEAMQMGIPVAASRIESIQEVCGDAVLYFDPCSVEEIQERVERLLLDDVLREALMKKGYEQIERYNWKTVAQRIYDSANACARPS